MATSEEIAWAAGIFEGEGTFHPQQKNPTSRALLEMCISMTDLDVLERFSLIAGCGTIKPKKHHNAKPHWKPQWIWRCSGSAAVDLAMKFRPHLCSRRKARLDGILLDIEDSQPKPRKCECCETIFEPTRFNRERFCSDDCRDRGKYLRRKYGTASLSEASSNGFSMVARPDLETHCPHGHALIGYNLYVYTRPNGNSERRCRLCAQLGYHQRKWRHIEGSWREAGQMSLM